MCMYVCVVCLFFFRFVFAGGVVPQAERRQKKIEEIASRRDEQQPSPEEVKEYMWILVLNCCHGGSTP